MAGFWGYTHARISARRPESLGRCDRCGFTYNLRALRWQYQWAGQQLINLNVLVCSTCLDVPNEQLRTLILPPDPVPVLNPRQENYDQETNNFFVTEDLENYFVSEDGVTLFITESAPPDPI